MQVSNVCPATVDSVHDAKVAPVTSMLASANEGSFPFSTTKLPCAERDGAEAMQTELGETPVREGGGTRVSRESNVLAQDESAQEKVIGTATGVVGL